ncbi:hypothetical protein ABUE38_02565 [Pediococcus parvulus]
MNTWAHASLGNVSARSSVTNGYPVAIIPEKRTVRQLKRISKNESKKAH